MTEREDERNPSDKTGEQIAEFVVVVVVVVIVVVSTAAF